MYGHCVRKFTSNGQFVTKWGEEGGNDGELRSPAGLTLNGNESIYVVDIGNSRIQKFTKEGELITKWGAEGSGDGQFRFYDNRYPGMSNFIGIAVDANGYVYVVDNGNYRIQKFTSNGEFIGKWGGEGTGSSVCLQAYV